MIEDIISESSKIKGFDLILTNINKKLLKQYYSQVAHSKRRNSTEKKDKYRTKEMTFLILTKEFILKDIYERHTMLYSLCSNVFKGKNNFEQIHDEDKSLNISGIPAVKELEVKKDQRNGKQAKPL